jgi:hypothetical protein
MKLLIGDVLQITVNLNCNRTFLRQSCPKKSTRRESAGNSLKGAIP